MDLDNRPIPPSSQDSDEDDRTSDGGRPSFSASLSENEDGTEGDMQRTGSSFLQQSAMNRKHGSISSMMSEVSEDDPRQVGLENGLFGDYDMKKSPSTKDFVLSYIDDEMARRNLPGRLSSVANENLTSKRSRTKTMTMTEVTISEEESIPEEKSPVSGSSNKESRSPNSPARQDSGRMNRGQEHIEISYEPEEERQSTTKLENLMANHVFKATSEVYMEGMESIVDDDFWKCFQSHKPRPWNWNAYLWPLWFCGVIIRYFILFPIRLVIFALGWILFGLGMLFAQGCLRPGPRRTSLEHSLISMMCGVFCITWGAVIRYHGAPVKVKPGECQPVYVANHTSMIDVIILQQMRCFSLVGQRHKGIVRFLQEVVLGCLQCVWFDRGEIKDRTAVAKKLNEHANDATRNPLLVFPEGTCVNNEYVIQFKKGIFEIGAPVVPVAIKYNKMFVDPFWNSRAQSFPMHLVELMTSWCLICEVWYLKPHVKLENESAEDFAGRVKQAIADKAGLKNVNWDGYMKYWKPSERYLRARQSVFAKTLRQIYSNQLKKEFTDRENRVRDLDMAFPDSSESNSRLRRRMVTS